MILKNDFSIFLFLLTFPPLSISVKGVSFAGFEITLKDTDKAVKNNIKNYLNTKRSLFYIKTEYDNFCEVFDSYHGIYDFQGISYLSLKIKRRQVVCIILRFKQCSRS